MEFDEGEKYFCTIPHYSDVWAPVSCVHGFASRNIRYYDDDNKYNWERIKQVWNNAWNKDNTDKTVLIEKSPPNIFRFPLLNKHFENSYFIAMLRNPYPQIEAWSRHFGGGERGNGLHDFYVDWVYHAEYIIKAINELGPRKILFIHYEDLIHEPNAVENKIKSFVPELHDFKVTNIVDNNKLSIERFNYDDIAMITDAMTDQTMFTRERIEKDRTYKLLDFFNYGIFHRIKMLSSIEYSFFTEKYEPHWQNNRFVEYYKIGKDGLIHDDVPSWMLYFGIASKKYMSMYYSKWRKI